MAGNNSSTFIYRPLLTQMSIKRGIGEAGVGTDLAPLVQHSNISGEFFQRNRQRIGHIDPKRAPGEFTKRMRASQGTMNTFLMVDRSIIKEVPVELVDGQDDIAVFDELRNASQEALSEIQHAHELDVNNLLWGSTQSDFNDLYGSSHVLDVNGNADRTAWDQSGAQIGRDVEDLKDIIYKDCGYMPNTLLLTKEVLNTIKYDANNELAERLKYTQGRVPDPDMLADYFSVDDVIIPRNLEDLNNPGQTANYDFMWSGDNVGLFYVDPTDSRNKETLASTFFLDKTNMPFLTVQTRFNEDNSSYESKVHAYYDVQLVDNVCGGVLFDVLA